MRIINYQPQLGVHAAISERTNVHRWKPAPIDPSTSAKSWMAKLWVGLKHSWPPQMDGSWQDDLENLQEDFNQKVKMLKQAIVRYIIYNYIPHHSSRLSSNFFLVKTIRNTTVIMLLAYPQQKNRALNGHVAASSAAPHFKSPSEACSV